MDVCKRAVEEILHYLPSDNWYTSYAARFLFHKNSEQFHDNHNITPEARLTVRPFVTARERLGHAMVPCSNHNLLQPCHQLFQLFDSQTATFQPIQLQSAREGRKA